MPLPLAFASHRGQKKLEDVLEISNEDSFEEESVSENEEDDDDVDDILALLRGNKSSQSTAGDTTSTGQECKQTDTTGKSAESDWKKQPIVKSPARSRETANHGKEKSEDTYVSLNVSRGNRYNRERSVAISLDSTQTTALEPDSRAVRSNNNARTTQRFERTDLDGDVFKSLSLEFDKLTTDVKQILDSHSNENNKVLGEFKTGGENTKHHVKQLGSNLSQQLDTLQQSLSSLETKQQFSTEEVSKAYDQLLQRISSSQEEISIICRSIHQLQSAGGNNQLKTIDALVLGVARSQNQLETITSNLKLMTEEMKQNNADDKESLQRLQVSRCTCDGSVYLVDFFSYCSAHVDLCRERTCNIAWSDQ